MLAFLTTTVYSDSEQTLGVLSEKRSYTSYPLQLVKSALPALISRASAAFITSITILILGLCGVFGENPTYTLPVFISLVLTTFFEVFLINIKFTKKGQGRSYSWLKVIIAYGILILVCAVTTQYPFDVNEFYPNGYGQFEYLIVPLYVVLYFIGIGISKLIEKNRKKR